MSRMLFLIGLRVQGLRFREERFRFESRMGHSGLSSLMGGVVRICSLDSPVAQERKDPKP